MLSHRARMLCLLAVAFITLQGCVTSGTHQKALDTITDLEAQLESERTGHHATRAENATLNDENTTLRTQLDAERAQVVLLSGALEQAQSALDQARVAIDALSNRQNQDAATQAALSQELDAYRDERKRLEGMLKDRGDENAQLLERLRLLQEIEREIRERDRIHQAMMGRLQSLIDAGQLEVSVVRGRLVLHLSQDVLFDTAKAELKTEGQRTLETIAGLIAPLTERNFQIEGHTDNVPIKNSRFASNWELSTARALAVVHLLTNAGVDPTQLSAAGYGEFQPISANDTPDGRQRNRRIEIVMLPNLNVISDIAPKAP